MFDKDTVKEYVLKKIRTYLTQRNARYVGWTPHPKPNQALRREIEPLMDEFSDEFKDNIIEYLKLCGWIQHYDGLEFTFAPELIQKESRLFGRFA